MSALQMCIRDRRNIASVGKSTHARRTFRPAFRYVIVLNLHQQDCILCLTKNAPERPVGLRAFPEHGRQMARQTRQTVSYTHLILAEGCDLAIENTMIYHTPEVVEQLESVGVPVLIERSSYESDPLGRIEWLKLYGALVGKEDAACAAYDTLLQDLQPVLAQKPAGKTVAFFYITTSGAVNVRKSGDYIAKAIRMAGGDYVSFDESGEENALSTMTIQMESFYDAAADADVLIYNSTIDGELDSLDALLAKSPLLADFRAVQTGNVWCITKNFYQESLALGDLILDVHAVLNDKDAGDLRFLRKLS